MNRAKFQKAPIRTWDKMKRLLHQCFLSADYDSVLFDKYQHCRQGTRSVSEYFREFHCLALCTNLQELEEQLVTRFIGGLKEKLRNKVIVHPQYSLMNAINVAERLERQSNHYSMFVVGSTSQPKETKMLTEESF